MRRALCMVMVLLFVVGFTAFAGGEQEAAGEGESAAEQFEGDFDWERFEGETIKLLLNKHPYTDGMLEELDEFEEMTGITVEYDIFPEEEYFNKVTVALSSGSTEYDAFMTGAYQVWQYAPAGWMEPLGPFMENDSITNSDYDQDDFMDGIIGSLRWDLESGSELGNGPQWALPWGFEANTLAYNKRVFDELDLETPDTIDELIEVGKVIDEETDMTPLAVRGTRSWATIHPGFMSAFYSSGGRDYDEDMNPVMNNDIGVRFVEKWVEMVQEIGPDQWTNYTWYDVGNSLGSEQSAMIYDADILAFFQNAEGESEASGDIAWTVGPGLDERADDPNVWIWSLSMSSHSERKGPAWYWLQWTTGKDFLTTAAVEHLTVDPVRESIWEHPDFQERLEDFDGYLETYNSFDNMAVHFTPQQKFFETTTEWASALHEVYNGDASAQEALDDLADTLREEVK